MVNFCPFWWQTVVCALTDHYNQQFSFFTVFGRETAVFSLEDHFLFYKKLLLFKIHLQNPKNGVANQVPPPKLTLKGQFLQFLQFLAGRPRFFPWKTVLLIHKKLLLIKIHLQNLKHVGANQVYPLKF